MFQKQNLNQNFYCEIIDSFKQNCFNSFYQFINSSASKAIQSDYNTINTPISIPSNQLIISHYTTQLDQITPQTINLSGDYQFGIPYCFCGKEAKYRCSRCKQAWYCSKECQKLDWKQHKLVCNSLNKEISTSNQTMQSDHRTLDHESHKDDDNHQTQHSQLTQNEILNILQSAEKNQQKIDFN